MGALKIEVMVFCQNSAVRIECDSKFDKEGNWIVKMAPKNG